MLCTDNLCTALQQVEEADALALLKATSTATRIAKLRLADTGFEERLAGMKERAARQSGSLNPGPGAPAMAERKLVAGAKGSEPARGAAELPFKKIKRAGDKATR